MNVLVVGCTGMLGHTIFSEMSQNHCFRTYGLCRTKKLICNSQNLFEWSDHSDQQSLINAIVDSEAQVVINCVGLIKQQTRSSSPLNILPVNSIFPHQLAMLCKLRGIRMIHISTDCVFSGTKGRYKESDPADAMDLYGRSKFMGEISDQKDVITIRTSIIGHELNSKFGLLEWFLGQNNQVKGFASAYFSGLTTGELSDVLQRFVIPNPELRGLWHIGGPSISKLQLIEIIKNVYQKDTHIVPDFDVAIDRTLNSERFQSAVGYSPPDWQKMVERMKRNRDQAGLNV